MFMFGEILSCIQRGLQEDATYEALRYRADGTPKWLSLHCFRTEWDGSAALQVLIADDTARYEALGHPALHGEWTGLPNRNALIASLRQHCKTHEPLQRFVLVLLSIDRFKLFNAAHGHTLRATMDADCGVVHWAGDGFALVSASDGNGDTAVDRVSRVRQLLAKPLLVSNLEQTLAQVEQLRAMGVHVAMDDFGTGFSSRNMLRSLRLHTVTTDRSLIDPLPSPDAVAVVRAIFWIRSPCSPLSLAHEET